MKKFTFLIKNIEGEIRYVLEVEATSIHEAKIIASIHGNYEIVVTGIILSGISVAWDNSHMSGWVDSDK